MTFEVGRTYQSAVKGRRFHVKMRFRVQDTDCLIVYLDTPSVLFGRTNHYYPAIIETEPGFTGTATVLLEEGFTTIYDEEGKE